MIKQVLNHFWNKVVYYRSQKNSVSDIRCDIHSFSFLVYFNLIETGVNALVWCTGINISASYIEEVKEDSQEVLKALFTVDFESTFIHGRTAANAVRM